MLVSQSRLWFNCDMTQAHELRSGDVVVVYPGDVRTVHHLTPSSVDQYAIVSVSFSDGSYLACPPSRSFVVLHPTPIAAPDPDVAPLSSPTDAPDA